MEYYFRQAQPSDLPVIWHILQAAILRRKQDGSNQWQDGYPNPEVIKRDIDLGEGFVLLNDETVVGYTAIIKNNEPAYSDIRGKWLTAGDFVVVHRVAIAEDHLGKGLAKKILSFVEEFAISQGINSVKADTNFDNAPMLNIFKQLNYVYCGEVFFRGSARKAFEKVL